MHLVYSCRAVNGEGCPSGVLLRCYEHELMPWDDYLAALPSQGQREEDLAAAVSRLAAGVRRKDGAPGYAG